MKATKVGAWFISKWQTRARDVGVFRAAEQMRKQGVPLTIALEVLVPR